MNAFLERVSRRLLWLALAGLGSTASGVAYAANYNVVLKAPALVTCATGGFNFTKNAAGSFPVTVTMMVTGPCVVQAGNYTGSLNVIVENVTLNGQNQGPNVVGLSGTLPLQGAGSGDQSAIGFAYTAGSASTGSPIRTLTLTAANGSTSTGTYDNFNEQTVPEPSALWLVFAGLVAMLLVGRVRKTA